MNNLAAHALIPKHLPRNILLFCLLVLCGLNQHVMAADCEFKDAVFKANFDGGRLDGCEQKTLAQTARQTDTPLHYVLSVKPENLPINPSPWYAFSAVAKDAKRSVNITVVADNARPRYVPKMSTDKKQWTPIDFSVDEKGLHFTLALSDEPIYVAAQELIGEDDYQQWIQQPAISRQFTVKQVGESEEKRPIYGLLATQAENTEWLVIIGRQHPPEITGALALFAFVERMSAPRELQKAFFNRFNVLVVPLLNPDGVVDGNWRHNNNGIDLNRDWGKFTQAETASTFAYIESLLKDEHRLVFALDFHSTQQDIFYTMPTEYGLVPADFSERFTAKLKDQRLGSFTVRERPGSSPGRGVFKQFIADHFGVHSITYEMGDNTNRKLIDHIAHKSADIMMQQMLETAAEDFIPEPKSSELSTTEEVLN